MIREIYLTDERHIDSGFYKLSAAEAKYLTASELPQYGRERRIQDGATGEQFWVARTIVNGKQVWSIRLA